MTPALEALIAEAERLDKEATPGPWTEEHCDLNNGNEERWVSVRSPTWPGAFLDDYPRPENPDYQWTMNERVTATYGQAALDAAFIAAARTLLPALAAALRRAERVVEAARVLDRLATPPMQADAWGALDAVMRAHDHPDATGGTGRE